MTNQNQKPGKTISLEIKSRIKESDIPGKVTVLESGLIFNKNEGPFFIEPGQPDIIGSSLAIQLCIQGIIIMQKNLEDLEFFGPDQREQSIEWIIQNIRNGLEMVGITESSNFDDI